MKKTVAYLILCMGILPIDAQELKMTFRGFGDANTIDWIRVTNQNSHETEPVILRITNPGIMDVEQSLTGSFEGMVYPNPFQGKASVIVNTGKPQEVVVSVVSLSGQEIARTNQFVSEGNHEFDLSVSKSGIFMVVVRSSEGITNMKAICSGAGGSTDGITYRGTGSSLTFGSGSDLKGKIKDPLDMREGDVILYECISGRMTTILTDIPVEPKRYDVQFAACTDPAGQDYPVIQVGENIWMAKNLAWLPEVSSSIEGSLTVPGFYVYGFKGRNVKEAQAVAGYSTYGALYNWKASREVCPDGWRLPTDQDWQDLERSLGMSVTETATSGWRVSGEVGCSLKEEGTEHWIKTVEGSVRETGFNALPAGFAALPMADVIWGIGGVEGTEGHDFVYQRKGACTFFWTATEIDKNNSWYRRLGCSESGVERKPGMKSNGYSVRCIRNLQIEDLVSDSDR
jgi:uncharacterized protein (TIGR02145 family)